MAGRLFAFAIDADMTGLDQRDRAGAGFDHPRMPQPFVETLALQATPFEETLFLTRFLPQISLRNLRKLDCYANRYPLRLKTLWTNPCGWR